MIYIYIYNYIIYYQFNIEQYNKTEYNIYKLIYHAVHNVLEYYHLSYNIWH